MSGAVGMTGSDERRDLGCWGLYATGLHATDKAAKTTISHQVSSTLEGRYKEMRGQAGTTEQKISVSRPSSESNIRQVRCLDKHEMYISYA